MLTQEQNDALTRTGPGTDGGAPVPVDILGEELVLFRDQQNRVGLLDRHCCHRGAGDWIAAHSARRRFAAPL